MQKSRRVVLFGSFYPNFKLAGNSSNSFAHLFSTYLVDSNLEVVGNTNSQVPVILRDKICLSSSWTPGHLFSLARVAHRMGKIKNSKFFFNIYLSSFGKGLLVNFVGLLIPIFLSKAKGKEVYVYMHNFLETQNIKELGYKPSILTKMIVSAVEGGIVRNTKTLVPLPSMSKMINEKLQANTSHLFIPYLEGIFSFEMIRDKYDSLYKKASIPRVLVFGAWSPQKDTMGIIKNIMKITTAEKLNIEIIVSGSINSNFTDYARQVISFLESNKNDLVRILKDPPEEAIPELFVNSDAIILPYNATGGQSGVLQLAAFYDLQILAYENDQMKEQADLLGIDIRFMQKNDISALEGWLKAIKIREPPTIESLDHKVKIAGDALRNGLSVLFD